MLNRFIYATFTEPLTYKCVLTLKEERVGSINIAGN